MAGYAHQASRFWMCPCGKRAYGSRADAKAALKQLRKKDTRMNIYHCEHWHGDRPAFHIGHLWDSVKSGEVGREQVWQGVRR